MEIMGASRIIFIALEYAAIIFIALIAVAVGAIILSFLSLALFVFFPRLFQTLQKMIGL